MSLEDSDSIDLIARSNDGRPLLVITDAGLSASDDERLQKLITKLKTYVFFVLSEDFQKRFPGSRPSDVSIEVVCAERPTEQMTQIGSIGQGGDKENRIAVHYRFKPPAY